MVYNSFRVPVYIYRTNIHERTEDEQSMQGHGLCLVISTFTTIPENRKMVDLTKAILDRGEGKVRLTGLGACDSLRLEAGLRLYGNDMEQDTTPVEAGIAWTLGKRRRAEGGFLGAEVILKRLEEGPARRRVGMISAGPRPRSHSEIKDASANLTGEVTSGVTRYTGEDGFEISAPSEHTVDLTKAILDRGEGKVRLTGLGACDSLRLEAGLCLYGNDMEQDTTPVEAGIAWTIGKRRRTEGGFLGAEVILKQLEEGPARSRVGMISAGPPPRSHSEILDASGNPVGKVTSGGFSPCLKKNIAMGM